MVCIVCLQDLPDATLSVDYKDSGTLFEVEFCVDHAHAAQAIIKKWIFETRESVLVSESDKKRWDKKPEDKEEEGESNK